MGRSVPRSSSCASLSHRSASFQTCRFALGLLRPRPSGSHNPIASAAGRHARSNRWSSAAAALRRSPTAAMSRRSVRLEMTGQRDCVIIGRNFQPIAPRARQTGAISMPAPATVAERHQRRGQELRAWRHRVTEHVARLAHGLRVTRSATTWSRAAHALVGQHALGPPDRAALSLRVRVQVERLLQEGAVSCALRRRCRETARPPHGPTQLGGHRVEPLTIDHRQTARSRSLRNTLRSSLCASPPTRARDNVEVPRLR